MSCEFSLESPQCYGYSIISNHKIYSENNLCCSCTKTYGVGSQWNHLGYQIFGADMNFNLILSLTDLSTVKVMSSQSVNLLTCFLGRLSPLSD